MVRDSAPISIHNEAAPSRMLSGEGGGALRREASVRTHHPGIRQCRPAAPRPLSVAPAVPFTPALSVWLSGCLNWSDRMSDFVICS